MENIIKIKKEIENIIIEIEMKEKNLKERFEENNYKTQIIKKYLEETIEEFHNICKNLYK